KVFVRPEKDVYGILYEIEGNAASSVQFFLTDSIKHYIRGALYFNVEPNKDSLAPVINFVKEDIKILIESFEWN
ncbi:MAG: gliding motility lipoprotein GldD, partial [Bacteroidales bacterium]|nr:gliding motility lipoprotein GldD [Bacteroidales bacterium]